MTIHVFPHGQARGRSSYLTCCYPITTCVLTSCHSCPHGLEVTIVSTCDLCNPSMLCLGRTSWGWYAYNHNIFSTMHSTVGCGISSYVNVLPCNEFEILQKNLITYHAFVTKVLVVGFVAWYHTWPCLYLVVFHLIWHQIPILGLLKCTHYIHYNNNLHINNYGNIVYMLSPIQIYHNTKMNLIFQNTHIKPTLIKTILLTQCNNLSYLITLHITHTRDMGTHHCVWVSHVWG